MELENKIQRETYPKEVQTAINSVKKMTRRELVNYFNDKIKYYEDYNKNNPNMSWAKDFPRNYEQKKKEVISKFDRYGIACYNVDYNHYGYGFDCEDIDVYMYTDGTYKISHHIYSAY